MCQNMYFIKISSTDGKLEYFCRNCAYVDEVEQPETVFSKLIEDNTATSYEHVINKYTKYDPTLPSIVGECKNERCPSHAAGSGAAGGGGASGESKIVYIRYDQEQMKFVFLCTVCDYSWILTK